MWGRAAPAHNAGPARRRLCPPSSRAGPAPSQLIVLAVGVEVVDALLDVAADLFDVLLVFLVAGESGSAEQQSAGHQSRHELAGHGLPPSVVSTARDTR